MVNNILKTKKPYLLKISKIKNNKNLINNNSYISSFKEEF